MERRHGTPRRSHSTQKKGRKRNAVRGAFFSREGRKEEMEKFEPRKEKKKQKNFSRSWGCNANNPHKNKRARIRAPQKRTHKHISSSVWSPFFFVCFRNSSALIRHHFRIRERDENAADDDDFILGRRRIFAIIIFTIIEEK